MAIEPWKVMLALSVLLAVFGGAVYLGVTSPVQFIVYVILLAGILVAMFLGYRLGNILAERSE